MQLHGEQILTALFAAIIAWLGASATFGSNGLTQLADLRASREALALEVIDIGNQIAELEETRTRLASDDAYLEHLARRELGLVYPDEVVYRFRAPRAE